MRLSNRNILLSVSFAIGITGCGNQVLVKNNLVVKKRETLVVQQDGSMVLGDRSLPANDVIIYKDGYGGERAAVKVRVPFHPDFYRDSIIVQREE